MSEHPRLQRWVEQTLCCEQQSYSLELVAGDASPRRYYRLTCAGGGAVPRLAVDFSQDSPSGGKQGSFEPPPPLNAGISSDSCPAKSTFIAVDAPATEKTPEFLAINGLLSQSGVRVPAVYASDLEQGFMLLEDLGDQTLLPLLTESVAGNWYEKGLSILSQTAVIGCDTTALEHYDAQKLQTELNVFAEWFVPQLLGLAWDDKAQGVFRELSSLLIERALAQPQRFVHRDFHSRNLMVVGDELAVIDFQDAVIGPLTYDPVSLLKDCYISWPREQQLQWLETYRQRLLAAGVLSIDDTQVFVVDFDLMGLQRHIKVLGVFARLSLRDGKHGYLEDLPLVLAYVRDALVMYAEVMPAIGQFRAWFESVVVPACEQQGWYQEIVLES